MRSTLQVSTVPHTKKKEVVFVGVCLKDGWVLPCFVLHIVQWESTFRFLQTNKQTNSQPINSPDHMIHWVEVKNIKCVNTKRWQIMHTHIFRMSTQPDQTQTHTHVHVLCHWLARRLGEWREEWRTCNRRSFVFLSARVKHTDRETETEKPTGGGIMVCWKARGFIHSSIFLWNTFSWERGGCVTVFFLWSRAWDRLPWITRTQNKHEGWQLDNPLSLIVGRAIKSRSVLFGSQRSNDSVTTECVCCVTCSALWVWHANLQRAHLIPDYIHDCMLFSLPPTIVIRTIITCRVYLWRQLSHMYWFPSISSRKVCH